MSHTVSGKARADREGGYSFECFDYDGGLFRAGGGFATQAEAIRAAEVAERHMMIASNGPTPIVMSDDELLAELGVILSVDTRF